MKANSVRYLILFFLLFSTAETFAKEILVIGDSHSCGSFGKTLIEELSKKNANVNLYCTVSSAPNHWITGTNPPGQVCKTMSTGHLTLQDCESVMPTLSKLLSDHKEALVIAAMGTNSLLAPTADRYYKQFAEAIEESGQSCVWIGPPHFNESQSKGFPKGRVALLNSNLNPFYTSLTAAVSGCKLIDSREATASTTSGYDTVDGVHRTTAAGKYWATEVAKEVLN